MLLPMGKDRKGEGEARWMRIRVPEPFPDVPGWWGFVNGEKDQKPWLHIENARADSEVCVLPTPLLGPGAQLLRSPKL